METGDVERVLDAATAALRASFAERAAIRRYQGMGGTFERLNALFRGAPTATPLARRLIAWAATIEGLAARATLPTDLVLYRGLEDLAAVVPPLDTVPQTSFEPAPMSTTLSREVAVRDFASVDPARGGVLRIEVGAGVPAVWIAPLGDPALRYEAEVLFARGTFLDFRRWYVVDRPVPPRAGHRAPPVPQEGQGEPGGAACCHQGVAAHQRPHADARHRPRGPGLRRPGPDLGVGRYDFFRSTARCSSALLIDERPSMFIRLASL